MNHRKLGLCALILSVSCLGALAVASDRHLTSAQDQDSVTPQVLRPEAANPVAASPSAEYLELQQQAIRQPSGELTAEAMPRVPDVAMPQR